MKKTIILCAVCVLASCSANLDMVGMFYGQSERNDVRFEQSMAYNNEHGMPEITTLFDEYDIVLGTDCHIDSTTYNLDHWISIAQHTPNCPFAYFLGDLVNAQGNVEKASKRFNNLMPEKYNALTMHGENLPFYGTPGNHDLYWDQWKEFVAFWKTSVYTITVTTLSGHKDLYVCLDSSDGTLGIKQMQWMKEVLSPENTADYRHVVVFTHTHMFMQDGAQGHTSNYTVEESYEIMSVLQQAGVEMYISGHAHSRNIMDYKGVRYIIVDTMQDPEPQPGYAILHVGENLDLEFKDLK